MLVLTGSTGLGQTFSRYKCNTTICYGTDGGPTHALFRELQHQLNRAGTQLGFRIEEDGFIGKNTVAAYRKVASLIPALVQRALASPKDHVELANWTRNQNVLEDVMLFADQLTRTEESPVEIERRAAEAIVEAKQTTPSTPTDSAGRPTATVEAQEAAAAARPRKSKAGLVVGGVAALAAIGLVGVALYQRRR